MLMTKEQKQKEVDTKTKYEYLKKMRSPEYRKRVKRSAEATKRYLGEKKLSGTQRKSVHYFLETMTIDETRRFSQKNSVDKE